MRIALQISLAYLVVSLLWILLSDAALAALFPTFEPFSFGQTIKGIGFVLVSALLLFGFSYQRFRQYVEVRRLIDLQAKLNEQLQLAHGRDQELLALKNTFIRMMTHDIRNPLATIATSVSTLQKHYTQMSDEQHEQTFERIQNQLILMRDMMEDLLTIGRAEERRLKVEPRPFDLVALLQAEIDTYRQSIHEKHSIVFQAKEESLPVILDMSLVQRVFVNLLSNAVKYSPSGGIVQVSAYRTNGDVVISVEDHGIGIPPEEVNRLFTPFSRCTNVGAIRGTGLGLTVVKHFVETLNGSISYESALNKGTTFTIQLPISL